MHRLAVAAVVALVSTLWFPSIGAASQITDVTPASGPTAGGSVLTINGTGFGAAGNLVTVGGSPCTVVAETPEQITCTLPAGTGASRVIRVMDLGGGASQPYPFGYEPPTITDITASTFPTAGGTTITIDGTNFGEGAGGQRVTVGVTPCQGVALSTPFTLECRLPPGGGTNVPVDVLVDGQLSAPSSLSYDPPVITEVTPTHMPAAGGGLITIRGENFGLSSTVTVGASPCPVAQQSHTQVECSLPPGPVGSADVSIVVQGGGRFDFPHNYGEVSSKCDAAKWKIAASCAQCLGGVESKAAKQGVATPLHNLDSCVAKCGDKCVKAETKFDDCSQVGTCASILEATRKGWDGTVKNKIQ